jgi:hypothetical protein
MMMKKKTEDEQFSLPEVVEVERVQPKEAAPRFVMDFASWCKQHQLKDMTEVMKIVTGGDMRARTDAEWRALYDRMLKS